MTAPTLFAFGTLLTWAGYAFALRTFFLALLLITRNERIDQRKTQTNAALGGIAAGLTLFSGSWITATKGLHIPLIWLIMPFSAWAILVSLIFIVVRLVQAMGALNQVEKVAKLKTAAAWSLAAALFVFFYKLDPQSQVVIVKGAIPLSIPSALALIFLAVATVAVMVLTARAAKARGIAKAFVTHIALILGSVIFGIPFAWLVITSFKEDIDMSSPNGIVWIPKVRETVPYFSPTNPVYTTEFEGQRVRGEIIEKHPDGTVKLDINRPMSMRGMTADTQMDKLTRVPTDAELVTAKMDGQNITGEVIEEMEDGHKRVQALSPPGMKGRQQVYAPTEVINIRKVGLRYQNYSESLDFLPPEAKRGLVYLQNTLLIVVLGLLGTVISSAIVAYAFSRMRFPGRDALFTLMLATMMLPGAVTKLPQFMIFKQFGWIDTLYPLWVPAFFGSAFNIFMLRQFFKQIPMELEDAAKIDGAGYIRTFWSVMMPQIRPAIAVIAILTFVGAWNNFMDPLIYINSPEHMTISYAVQLYSSDRGGEPGMVTAFTTMSMAPVLALFFFAQRYFIEGVTLSGLGGR